MGIKSVSLQRNLCFQAQHTKQYLQSASELMASSFLTRQKTLKKSCRKSEISHASTVHIRQRWLL